MQAKTRVTIIETTNHFLYLPVHFAQNNNWFGYIPESYEIILDAVKSKTDHEAYKLLVQRKGQGLRESHEFIGFAIADPATLITDAQRAKYQYSPIVLGGLITNSSFWAFDRNTHNVRSFSDLALFDKIIAYPAGSTSHGIAKRIFRDANKTPVIEEVEPGNEFRMLKESALGTMALTPDLLHLDELLSEHNGKYQIDLSLGKTPEYNNVLVTALLSRTDVVNEHAELVRGILRAIQRSMLLVRFTDPLVIAFAKQAHKESEKRIRGALQRAADAQVFPATLEVSEAHWLNAARASAMQAGLAFGAKEHDDAKNLYEIVVSQYINRFMPTVYEEVLPRLNADIFGDHARELARRNKAMGSIFGCAGGMFAAATLILWLRSTIPLIVFAAMVAATWLTFRISMKAWWHILHVLCLFCGAGIVAYFAKANPRPGKDSMISIAIGWIGMEIAVLAWINQKAVRKS